jgi:hypothetical protein
MDLRKTTSLSALLQTRTRLVGGMAIPVGVGQERLVTGLTAKVERLAVVVLACHGVVGIDLHPTHRVLHEIGHGYLLKISAGLTCERRPDGPTLGASPRPQALTAGGPLIRELLSEL